MTDLIDELINDWHQQRPDLDVYPMAVVGRIIRLSKKLEKEVGEVLKPYGLKYTELDVLATLRRKGEPFQLNPKQLMQSVLLTSGAMTACLDRLEKKQLLKRINDPNDRRGRLIELSQSGKDLIDQAIAARFQQAKDRLSSLTNDQQQHLVHLLRLLT